MRFRRSLRYRVALAFAVFGGFVSLLLAIALFLASADLERRLVDEALTAELEDYVTRRQRNPHSIPPATATVRGYVLSSNNPSDDIPSAVQELEPGRYQLVLEETPYHVSVADRGGERFFLLYDETRLQRRERHFMAFLAAGVLVMMLLSAGGGLWLAGRVISPVTELAQRVRQLSPQAQPVPLADDFPHDEVGELAQAFDHYLTRLQAFIERERFFTADVSHELRTPLAIINGAAEVLLADNSLPNAARERVARIARAAREMSKLISALLILAREEKGVAPPQGCCKIEEVLRDVVEKHRYLLKAKPVEVDLDIQAHPSLSAERAVLVIVLGNIIRNAFSYTDQGIIRISLEAQSVTVEDTGSGICEDELSHLFERYHRGQSSTGAGIGLSLVKRICDHYGWRIAIESQEGRGTQSRLFFASSISDKPCSAGNEPHRSAAHSA